MSKLNVSQKLIRHHLALGNMVPQEEIGLRIDQTLSENTAATFVIQNLKAMGCTRVKTEISVQYMDLESHRCHSRNREECIFLQNACQKYGLYYSSPEGEMSPFVFMELFGKPGKTLLGSTPSTCAAGAMGMLALASTGFEIASTLMGEPFFTHMPQIMGIHLKGKLPSWISPKEIILELLRRHGATKGSGKIFEYYGAGLKNLDMIDRSYLAQMGTLLGAMASVFPSDDQTKHYLKMKGRLKDYRPLQSDLMSKYDEHDEIDLCELTPSIAFSSQPYRIIPIKEVEGQPISQVSIGFSHSLDYRDFTIAASMLKGRKVHPSVSFDIHPASRSVLEHLARGSDLADLLRAGAHLHQTGCKGCLEINTLAPEKICLSTSFENSRDKLKDLSHPIHFCSSEVAVASALKGVITDPRTLRFKNPSFKQTSFFHLNKNLVIAPSKTEDSTPLLETHLGAKILQNLKPIKSKLNGKILFKLGDHVSAENILAPNRTGASQGTTLSETCAFFQQDSKFYSKALENQHEGFFIVAGENFGYGLFSEQAALSLRLIGCQAILAQSYHTAFRSNLINCGILPLIMSDPLTYQALNPSDQLEISQIIQQLETKPSLIINNETQNKTFEAHLKVSAQELKTLKHGSIINAYHVKSHQKSSNDFIEKALS